MVSTSRQGRVAIDSVGTSTVPSTVVGEALGDGTGRSAGDVGCTVSSGFLKPAGPTCSRFSGNTGEVGEGRSVGTNSSGEAGTDGDLLKGADDMGADSGIGGGNSVSIWSAWGGAAVVSKTGGGAPKAPSSSLKASGGPATDVGDGTSVGTATSSGDGTCKAESGAIRALSMGGGAGSSSSITNVGTANEDTVVVGIVAVGTMSSVAPGATSGTGSTSSSSDASAGEVGSGCSVGTGISEGESQTLELSGKALALSGNGVSLGTCLV